MPGGPRDSAPVFSNAKREPAQARPPLVSTRVAGLPHFLLCLLLAASCVQACDGSIYRIWIPRHPAADPLFRFTRGDKAGYIDQSGTVVIPPQFRNLDGPAGAEFHDGLLEVGVSNGVYADRTGQIVIDMGLYRGWDFSEGLAVAMRQDSDRWGYINTKGDFAISPRFESSGDSYVWSFQGGYEFNAGLAPVRIGSVWGYIDRSGAVVIRPRFTTARPFADGLAAVSENGRFGYIDRTGAYVVLPRFAYAEDFVDDRAVVGDPDAARYWYIDRTGAPAIAGPFALASPFFQGLAHVKLRSGNAQRDASRFIGTFAYIDRTGRQVFSYVP